MSRATASAPARSRTWLWATAAAVVAWSGWIALTGEDTVEPVARADRANRRPAAPVERMSPTGPGTALAPNQTQTPPGAAPAASGAVIAAARLEPRAQADAFGARSFEPAPPPPPKAA
ncbi:MAG: hypothetical protein RLZZ524_31, partial [Pseudomonadota bacterium]